MERLWQAISWRRVLVTAGCVVAWRALDQIAVVGPRPGRELFSIYVPPSYSVGVMGLSPYINALVIFSLAPIFSRTVRRMRDTADGRIRLQRWIRASAVVLALGQAYGFTRLAESNLSVASLDWLQRLVMMLALTAGTMALLFIAELMDESGLGFGYGVFVIQIFSYIPREMGRLGSFIHYASAFSNGRAYEPLVAWIAISVVLIVLSVAILRGHRVITPLKPKRVAAPIVLPVIMSGVLRPPIFASGVMSLPNIAANYYARAKPEIATWIGQHWTPYGPNPLTDVGYTLVYAGVVAGMVYLVVASDFDPRSVAKRLTDSELKLLRATVQRLTFSAAMFLAVMVAVVPVLADFVTRGSGNNGPSVSGTYVVLTAAVVLAIATRLEKKRPDEITFSPRLL